MLIEIATQNFWDDEKPFYQQSEEAQKLVNEAVQTPALRSTYETCLESERRVTLREYQSTQTHLLQVIPVYNTGPMEREFMGMSDFIYLITEA